MSTTRDDILWDRYEEQCIARDEMEYDDECSVGYVGSFEQFRQAKVESARRPATPVADLFGADDIAF